MDKADTIEFMHTLIQDIRNKLRNLNPDDVRGAEFAKILADVEYLNKYFVKHKAGLKDEHSKR